MSWDTRDSRNRVRASSSQGWSDPSWWDDAPASDPAPVRSAPPKALVQSPPASAGTATVARSGLNGVGVRDKGASGNGSSGNGSSGNGTDAQARTERLEARRNARAARGGLKARSASGLASLRFAVGFGAGIFGALLGVYLLVAALSGTYDGKVMPGVHAGKVDLSGLTRQEAIAKINSVYGYIGQGKIVVTTPGGNGTITFAQAGRNVDAAAMADAAMKFGRAGDPISSTALALRTFAGGANVPVLVKIDPVALETRLHELTGASVDPPKNASVSVSGTNYSVVAGAAGRGIDEVAIARQLIDKLVILDTPSTVNIGGKFVSIPPSVSEQDAQRAIDSANKMAVEFALKLDDKTWAVTSDMVRQWTIFGWRTDGTYGPVVNPASVQTYVTGLSKQVNYAPVEPTVQYVKGNPTGFAGGKSGRALDVNATAQAIEVYLDGLGAGGPAGSGTIALVATEVPPQLNDPNLKGFVIIGAVTTTYFPGESNGWGANIAIPAKLLNGQVVAAGGHFSFMRAVAPIDEAHGWKKGGVIIKGQSQHTGAIGGGICSASTTFFQTVAIAGLQVDERHAHQYWIDRYALDGKLGLDATVFSNGTTTYDLRFTNDTDYPIVIRSWTEGSSSKKRIHVQLWSLPNGRKVTFSGGKAENIVKATDSTQYVGNYQLPNGAHSYRREYPDNGFDTSVSRAVVDKDGVLLHNDTWNSHYIKVDGWLQIAGTKPPPQKPGTPHPPTPTPAAPTPPPGGRLRRKDEDE